MQVPAPFDYVRATSVADVLELLERHGPEARVIAGGHSLLPMMKLRLARPDWLIDINDLAELRHITVDGDWLRVGALTRHADLLASDVVGAAVPDDPRRGEGHRRPRRAQPRHDRRLARAGRPGRGPHHRLRRPPGPGRSSPPAAASGPSTSTSSTAGRTRPPASSTNCSPRSGSRSAPAQASAYEKVERRVGDWAVGAAGAALWMAEDGTIADATIGLTALGLEGLAAEAGGRARRPAAERGPVRRGRRPRRARPARPIEDQRGPVDYKRHLAGELTRRVLARALDRAAHPTAVQGG